MSTTTKVQDKENTGALGLGFFFSNKWLVLILIIGLYYLNYTYVDDSIVAFNPAYFAARDKYIPVITDYLGLYWNPVVFFIQVLIQAGEGMLTSVAYVAALFYLTPAAAKALWNAERRAKVERSIRILAIPALLIGVPATFFDIVMIYKKIFTDIVVNTSSYTGWEWLAVVLFWSMVVLVLALGQELFWHTNKQLSAALLSIADLDELVVDENADDIPDWMQDLEAAEEA